MLLKLAEVAGVFVGHVLKICAPQIAAIIAEGIRNALTEKMVVSRPNADLRDEWVRK